MSTESPPTEQTILAALHVVAVPERATHALGYFPTSMKHLGVPVPALRAVLKPVIASLRKAPPGEATRLALALCATGIFDAKQAGFEVLNALPKERRALTAEQVVGLAEGNDNWCSVDTYSTYLSGPAWREGTLTDAMIATWSASPDRWLRRTALVSTVPLNMKSRGGTGDTPRTLAVCAHHAHDRDDMVVKALSWALRELAERDPDAVEAFLTSHDVAPRVRRETRNKLDTGLKNP